MVRYQGQFALVSRQLNPAHMHKEAKERGMDRGKTELAIGSFLDLFETLMQRSMLSLNLYLKMAVVAPLRCHLHQVHLFFDREKALCRVCYRPSCTQSGCCSFEVSCPPSPKQYSTFVQYFRVYLHISWSASSIIML